MIVWSVGEYDAHGVTFANFAQGTGREWLEWQGTQMEVPAISTSVQARPNAIEDGEPPVTE